MRDGRRKKKNKKKEQKDDGKIRRWRIGQGKEKNQKEQIMEKDDENNTEKR